MSIAIIFRYTRSKRTEDMGSRHTRRRDNRRKLKADTVVLLDRIAANDPNPLTDKLRIQIAEMRMRLDPPTGVKAPIIHTGFTK